MDFIIVFGIGAILVATGVISPDSKDMEIKQTEVIKTEDVIVPPPEIKPEPDLNMAFKTKPRETEGPIY